MKKSHRNGPGWVVADVDDSVGSYYRYWVRQRTGLKLAPPAWGCHVTVIRDRDNVFLRQDVIDELEGRRVPFEYNVQWETHWRFASLNVRSKFFDIVREWHGLNRDFPFHLTFGRLVEHK